MYHLTFFYSSRGNADYYTAIKDPIDLTQIQQKIHSDDYTSYEQFLDDFDLLLTNAKNFYRKNSTEWKDANELSKYISSKTNPSSQSIDSYYFEEFFTAIYNAQIDDRPITDVFLFLPSRKVRKCKVSALFSSLNLCLDLSRLLSNSN